jgi:hypothetical protein
MAQPESEGEGEREQNAGQGELRERFHADTPFRTVPKAGGNNRNFSTKPSGRSHLHQ